MRVRLSTVAVLFAATISGVALIGMSQKVQVEEARQEELLAAVQSEKETIRVLQAEWSYLNRPARIESLAHRYLHMSDSEAESLLKTVDTLPDLYVPALPVRKPVLVTQNGLVRVSATAPTGDFGQSSRVVNKKPVPSTPSVGRSFQSLLGDLSAGTDNGGQR